MVYCTALKVGNEDDWNFAWERFKKSNVASEKDLLLEALGCTRDVSILSRSVSLDDRLDDKRENMEWQKLMYQLLLYIIISSYYNNSFVCKQISGGFKSKIFNHY